MSLFKQALAALGVAAAAVLSPGVLGDTHQVPPASESSEHVLLSNVRQLIFEGRRSSEGYFSADGTVARVFRQLGQVAAICARI